MKIVCENCKQKNALFSKYCEYCGEEIPERKFEEAYKKSGYRKLEIADSIWGKVTMSSLLDNKYLKTGFVILLLLVGLFFSITGLNKFEIKNSDSYELNYNTTNKIYEITCDSQEKVGLNLAVPRGTEKLLVTTYDKAGSKINDKEYKLSDAIVFGNVNDSYYEIAAGNKKLKVEFFIKEGQHE